MCVAIVAAFAVLASLVPLAAGPKLYEVPTESPRADEEAPG